MLRFLQSDVLKIFIYVGAALVGAAVISPWIYSAGMGLAEITATKPTNGFLSWLGEHAGNAKDNFPRYFDRALLLSAVVLLFPLLAWLKLGRARARFRDTPWSVPLPDAVVAAEAGQPLRRNPDRGRHLAIGFALSAGFLAICGWILINAGLFVWRDAAESAAGVPNPKLRPIEWWAALRKGIASAVAVSLIEELLFRGVLLGLFLRAMRPAFAIATLSFLFAFVHFLEPPKGASVPDPEALNAGFVLLGQIFAHFADLGSLIGQFLVLASVGVVLAVARYRTASLWLPIGLHAGWVFALSMFKSVTWPVRDLPEATRWVCGSTLMEGMLPLLMVIMTGTAMAWMTRPHPAHAEA